MAAKPYVIADDRRSLVERRTRLKLMTVIVDDRGVRCHKHVVADSHVMPGLNRHSAVYEGTVTDCENCIAGHGVFAFASPEKIIRRSPKTAFP